jgi:hypothetical protein
MNSGQESDEGGAFHTVMPAQAGMTKPDLNQTIGLWHTVAQGEKTQPVRSERSRASGEVEERTANGLSGLRLRSATLRPNGESIHCQ